MLAVNIMQLHTGIVRDLAEMCKRKRHIGVGNMPISAVCISIIECNGFTIRKYNAVQYRNRFIGIDHIVPQVSGFQNGDTRIRGGNRNSFSCFGIRIDDRSASADRVNDLARMIVAVYLRIAVANRVAEAIQCGKQQTVLAEIIDGAVCHSQLFIRGELPCRIAAIVCDGHIFEKI